MVTWKRYDYVEVPDKRGTGEVRKKIALVTRETPVRELFKYFVKLLNDYTYHTFMAKWQKEQFDSLLDHLAQNHVVYTNSLQTTPAPLSLKFRVCFCGYCLHMEAKPLCYGIE